MHTVAPIKVCGKIVGEHAIFCFLSQSGAALPYNFIHLYVDFITLPVDCQNFIAQTAAMLYFLILWLKTLQANFIDRVDKIV